MRVGWIIVCALVILPAGSSAEQTNETPEQVFVRGNSLYEVGDYDGAVEAYGSLVERGAVDKELFYNMGNAYYELGALGSAVLYYERVLRLDPRHGDAVANLALTRLMLRDREFLRSKGWLRRIVMWIPRRLSTRELVVLTSSLYLLLAVIVMALIFRDTSFVTGVYRRLSVLSPGRLFGVEKATDITLAGVTVLAVLIATGVSARQKWESRWLDAVVLHEEISVYGGPSAQATLQFKIHEGTVTRVVDMRPGWVEIELPGELSGWVRAEALERI
ncbi:MAG: tetratricopeptide repeat protein [Candidatus Krumholzibacteriota bacterium]|nr:tetratricopeptide repeat protein [Candidatus Krumholzibacteriota bacterium]